MSGLNHSSVFFRAWGVRAYTPYTPYTPYKTDTNRDEPMPGRPESTPE